MNLKKLLEMRSQKQAEMKEIIKKADTDERTLNTEELEQFEKLEKEINILKYILGVNFDIDLSEDVGNSYRVYISKNNRHDNTILFIGKEEYELLKGILEND